MLPTTHHRPHFIAVAVMSTVALATVLSACGDKDGDGPTNASGQVASLQKEEPSASAAAAGKKYKPGSPEYKKALDTWHAQFQTCEAKKAQQLGIGTKTATGKDAGELTTKEDMGPTLFKGGKVSGSPLAVTWWTKVVEPCRQEVPAPQAEDDGDSAAALKTAKKQYECLSKAGLGDLHEPTNDNMAPFAPAGTQKYFGPDVDPKSKEILQKCGIGGQG